MVNIEGKDRDRILELARKLIETNFHGDFHGEFNGICDDLAAEIEAADTNTLPSRAWGEFEFFVAVDENGMVGCGRDSEAAREDLMEDTSGDCCEVYTISGRVPSAKVRRVNLGTVETLDDADERQPEVTATRE